MNFESCVLKFDRRVNLRDVYTNIQKQSDVGHATYFRDSNGFFIMRTRLDNMSTDIIAYLGKEDTSCLASRGIETKIPLDRVDASSQKFVIYSNNNSLFPLLERSNTFFN